MMRSRFKGQVWARCPHFVHVQVTQLHAFRRLTTDGKVSEFRRLTLDVVWKFFVDTPRGGATQDPRFVNPFRKDRGQTRVQADVGNCSRRTQRQLDTEDSFNCFEYETAGSLLPSVDTSSTARFDKTAAASLTYDKLQQQSTSLDQLQRATDAVRFAVRHTYNAAKGPTSRLLRRSHGP